MNTPVTTLDALDMTCLAARTVAAEVRQRIGLRLAAWGLKWRAADVQLIAVELVTNACAATPGGRIKVRFARESAALLLAVWDGSNQLPQVQPVKELELKDLDLDPENFDSNGGWGLQLVQALASECGVTKTNPNGKWVWARFSM